MAEIGTFTRTETGYAGELHSFGLHEKLFIVPAKASDVKNGPTIACVSIARTARTPAPHGKTPARTLRVRVDAIGGANLPVPDPRQAVPVQR